jgi:hypothetical protein
MFRRGFFTYLPACPHCHDSGMANSEVGCTRFEVGIGAQFWSIPSTYTTQPNFAKLFIGTDYGIPKKDETVYWTP